MQIDIKDVMSVYSGKTGKCMCGCFGKYYYASTHQVAASRYRRYQVTDSEVDDRMVKRITNKINKALAIEEVGGPSNFCSLDIWEGSVAVVEGNRIYVVHLVK
jgi:hypothetical protein